MKTNMRVLGRDTTEKLGNVPETEPKAVLPVLPPEQDPHAKRVDDAFKNLRYRAHRYHGVTRMDPPVGKHEIDFAASELARAAMRFAHAFAPESSKIDPAHPEKGCACIFCV